MDKFSKKKRSEIMSKVKGINTGPEKKVRSLLHSMGYRFRLHKKDLPGNPDMVLKKYKTVIFVNGCFWHQHENCKSGRLPKSNIEFWSEKLKKNVIRDEKNYNSLKSSGWNVLVLWECQIKKDDQLRSIIADFFASLKT